MADKVKRGWLYRQKGEDGKWSSWKVAELGIPSLIVKGQDRDDYEVEEVVAVSSLPPEARDAILKAEGFGAETDPVGVDRGRELCHAHGAYGPEGDCFVCDTRQAREWAEAAEAKLIYAVLRSMGQKAEDFDVDLLTKFTDLDRERIEQALDRLEDEDEVRALTTGADRPHWTLVID